MIVSHCVHKSVSVTNNAENDLNLIEMIRTLSDLMQSGRSTTLAQVMREIGQPVTRLDTGPIIFVA